MKVSRRDLPYVLSTRKLGATTVAASLIGNTANATSLSTWGTRGPATATFRYGAAAIAGSNIATWTTTSETLTSTAILTALNPAMGTITKLLCSDSNLVALTADHKIWTSGPAFGGSAWIERAAGVADFSFWGFTTDKSYAGGLWIDASGAVTQFFSNTNSGWDAPQLVRQSNKETGTPLTGITKTFSSDGTYLALKSDGTVYAWGGNLDNDGRAAAATVSTGSGTVTDLNVWGRHIADLYYGGGYVIKADVGTC